MQLTRTTQSPTDHSRTVKTIRQRRRRGHSHVRTRSGSLGHQYQERRRRSYTRSGSSSSSSSSGDEHHHKGKKIGATLVGAAGGGALAKEVLGGGKLATLGGAVAGAVAANALEKRHERYVYHLSPQVSIILLILVIYSHTRMMWSSPLPLPPQKKVLTRCPQKNLSHKDERRSGFSDRDYPEDNNRHHHHHHHRSSLDPREIKDEIKDKLTDFFSSGTHDSGKRSRSQSGGRSRRSSRR